MKNYRFRKKTRRKIRLAEGAVRGTESGWRDWRRFLKYIFMAVGVVLVALVILYWQRSAIRRFGNEWSADRHLARARQELEAGSPGVALRRAITSLQLEPGRLDTTRVLLRAARESGDPRVMMIGQMLFSHPEAGPDDRIQGIAAINDVGDNRRFSLFWNQLTDGERSLPGARVQHVRHLVISGQLREALATLEGSDVVGDTELGLLKIEVLLQQGGETSDRAAQELALRMIDASRPDQNERLRRILNRLSVLSPERFDPGLAPRFAAAIGEYPDPGALEPTLAYTLRIAESPIRRGPILYQAFQDLQRDDLDPLCFWLMRLRENRFILDHITEIQAYRSNAAYESRVRALIGSGRLEDALALLQYPPDIADKMGVFAMRAAVARSLGRKADETNAWAGAMLEAERDQTQNRFLRLARVAQEAGEKEIAAGALVAACRHPRGMMPPVREIEWLFQYLIEKDQPQELLTVSRRLMQSEWSNPVLVNNAVYLSLILGGEGAANDNVIATIDDLAGRYPGVLGIRTTRALAFLLAGRHDDAFAVFRPEEFSGIGWQQFAPADRAVFAMVLESKDMRQQAGNVKSLIDWPSMLAVERQFFRARLFPGEPEKAGEEKTDSEPFAEAVNDAADK